MVSHSLPRYCFSQSLLSLRKQQGVACLAYSCDWLAQKLFKMSSVIKQQPSGSSETSVSSSETNASGQKLLQMARKLSQLADDGVICLRLEVRVVYVC